MRYRRYRDTIVRWKIRKRDATGSQLNKSFTSYGILFCRRTCLRQYARKYAAAGNSVLSTNIDVQRLGIAWNEFEFQNEYFSTKYAHWEVVPFVIQLFSMAVLQRYFTIQVKLHVTATGWLATVWLFYFQTARDRGASNRFQISVIIKIYER